MRSKDLAPRAVDLIEESVHLLRRHPERLAGYYASSGPFAVGLVYFWAYVTWFAPPDGEVAAGALLLALLFGFSKAGQNRFAGRLLALRSGEEAPAWRTRDWLAETAAQLRTQAPGIVLVPLAALFGVPFAWIYGHYQTATVLPRGDEEAGASRSKQAWALAQLWPVPNHWALLILSGLWLMVFLNLAVAFYLVPSLVTNWLGLRTGFALSGWNTLNSTFLALVAVLTHLLVDPLIKTYFVLRVYYGRSRQTGDDLRLVLRQEGTRGRVVAPLAALILMGAVFLAAPRLPANETGATPVAPVPTQTAPARLLNPALDRVLEQPAFRWRLRPAPIPPDREKEGIIKGFVRSTFDVIVQMVKTVIRWFEALHRWVSGLLPGEGDGGDAAAPGERVRSTTNWMSVLQWTAYVLIVGVAGLLLFTIWKVISHNRTAPLRSAPVPAAPAAPDLRDETVEASRLPAEGWLDLARQQAAAGEWRLALRALFLATLARHAQEGLLSLAKFKTNLDYESELRRRARSRQAVVEDFGRRRRQFEEVWYGSGAASDTAVGEWLRTLEGRP
ncbi:hypothetical protein ESB00_16645 [Oleiharenicola lentus]|uniref:DUF4129 domain-containing protein n=1 Tax=Oleiharenicola lentus TaxID=2508720 RepID=A0A4Q1C4W1_9BACT|nr:hypothetical protein ESB00_16645 [Oleiharenicola lentus]